MTELLWTLLFAAVGFLPIEQLLLWTYDQVKVTKEKLDTPKKATYFCKRPIILLTSKLITFLKGFALPWGIYYITSSELSMLICVMSIVAAALWLPKYKKTTELWCALWGILTYLSPLLVVIFPVGYLLTLLLLQNTSWGILGGMAVSGLFLIFTTNFGIEYIVLIAILSLISITWYQKQN